MVIGPSTRSKKSPVTKCIYSSPVPSKQAKLKGAASSDGSKCQSAKKQLAFQSFENSLLSIQQDKPKQGKSQVEILEDLLNTQTKRFQTKKRDIKDSAKKSQKSSNKEFGKDKRREQEGQSESQDQTSEDGTFTDEDSTNNMLKRVRKNRDQIKALMKAYEQAKGNWTKQDQKNIAHQLGLSEQQVYKWSWDQLQKRKKVVHINEYSLDSKNPQCTDEFGGYSKSWFLKNESGLSSFECTQQQEDIDGIDSISSLVGIDIEKLAKDIISIKSPEGQSKRQITKPILQMSFSIIPEFTQKPQKETNKSNTLSQQNSFKNQTSSLEAQTNVLSKALNFLSIQGNNTQQTSQTNNNTPKFPQISQSLFKSVIASPQSEPTPTKDFTFDEGLYNQDFQKHVMVPDFPTQLLRQISNENTHIKSAALNLFQDLPQNLEDDPMLEEKQMQMELQRQNSIKMNSMLSPLFYLMPLNSVQSEAHQNQRNIFMSTPHKFNMLSSVRSNKMVLCSPSPNMMKFSYLP